jgi:hypothetical protein
VRPPRSSPGAGLEPLDRQDIIVLNLQRAVQAMLDLAAHVVAREGLGVSIRPSWRPSVRDRLGDLRAFAKAILERFRI